MPPSCTLQQLRAFWRRFGWRHVSSAAFARLLPRSCQLSPSCAQSVTSRSRGAPAAQLAAFVDVPQSEQPQRARQCHGHLPVHPQAGSNCEMKRKQKTTKRFRPKSSTLLNKTSVLPAASFPSAKQRTVPGSAWAGTGWEAPMLLFPPRCAGIPQAHDAFAAGNTQC